MNMVYTLVMVGTATSSQYFRISNSGVGLFNVPLRMYTGGTETVHIGG